ncbi:hypothetical protein ABW636_00205 [Aquimarina sp. 2201CG1-2-11]|uniref:hypothetical protein n=1 Tax=Aquimarina discodermiae TaxID=3231043 RepID=UPI003462985F
MLKPEPIDASVIDTSLKPKSKTNHKVTENRENLEEVEVTKEYADSVDKKASLLKKQGKYRYGYKKYYVTLRFGFRGVNHQSNY